MIFNLKYFLFALALFIAEVLIALFAHENFVRPYLGDVLVVMLLYGLVKSFFPAPSFATAFSGLLFACGIEVLQYFQIVRLLGLQHSRLANIVIGNYFTWNDILCYIAGFVLILLTEKTWIKKANPHTSPAKAL